MIKNKYYRRSDCKPLRGSGRIPVEFYCHLGPGRKGSQINKKLWSEALIALALALVVYLGVSFSVQNARVLGDSMSPGLRNGERVFINKLAYRFEASPQRGDIIVFVPPAELGSTWDYIKRVIGLPGERVEVKDGGVYIHEPDGEVFQLDENTYASVPAYSYYSDVIPEGRYFVMGDNRGVSEDSHNGWTVPFKDIVGRAWVIVWPPSEWGPAPNNHPPS